MQIAHCGCGRAESLREESQHLLQQLEAANETIVEKTRRISALELSVHVKLQEQAAPTPREPMAVPITPPHRQAPESVGDVAILRELANCSARTSVTHADRRRYNIAALRELIAAATMLIVGGIAMGISTHPFSRLWFLGMIGLGTGACMALRGLQSARRLRLLRVAPDRSEPQ